MRKLRGSSTATVGLILTHTALASATLEPPAVSDARNAALGGTGVAYTDNAAAVYHNPAGLTGVGQGAVTLSISPFMPQLEAPIGGTQEKSTRSFFPMFLGGGAYRLTDDLVLGLAVYPVMGFGGEYPDLEIFGGEELELSAATFEASPSLAYSITDAVSIGVGYRITYMMQDVHQVTPAMGPGGTPVFVASDLSLSGMNFLGAHLGVLARVTDTTRVGFTYRNKVTVDLEGDFESGGMKLDASSEFSAPHSFKLGLAQDLLDEQLMLAFELKYALYSESSESTVTTIDGLGTTEIPLEWKNSLSAALGVEYRLGPEGPDFRLGYCMTQSATSEDYPQPFMPPPGLLHSVHLGAGMQFSQLELDVGGFYVRSKATDLEPAADAVAEPGDYAMDGYIAALSATYRL